MTSSVDDFARKSGFKDALTMNAYYQRQREMASAPNSVGVGTTGSAPGPQASSGSVLDRLFAWHPAVLLGHVLNAFSQAGQ